MPGTVKKGDRRALLNQATMERGAFAEYINVAHDEDNFAVPDDVTDEQAATLPVPFFTAVYIVVHAIALICAGSAFSARRVSPCRCRRARARARQTRRSTSIRA